MLSLVALFAFMLIPVWIPIITVSFGALFDVLRPTPPSELTERMEALRMAPKPHVHAVPATSAA